MPAPNHSKIFYRPDALLDVQTNSVKALKAKLYTVKHKQTHMKQGSATKHHTKYMTTVK